MQQVDTRTLWVNENSIDFHEKLPEIKLALVSNVWIKMMTFNKAGDFIPGHKHLFDHPTILAQGSALVEVNGVVTEFTAPAIIYIEKQKVHKITAKSPGTVACCVHALRDGGREEDIISPDMLPKGTSPLGLNKSFPELLPIISRD